MKIKRCFLTRFAGEQEQGGGVSSVGWEGPLAPPTWPTEASAGEARGEGLCCSRSGRLALAPGKPLLLGAEFRLRCFCGTERKRESWIERRGRGQVDAERFD